MYSHTRPPPRPSAPRTGRRGSQVSGLNQESNTRDAYHSPKLNSRKAGNFALPPHYKMTSTPASTERIYADNSNVADLKATCDDAVERILTRASNPVAPAPSANPTQKDSQEPSTTFPPFKVSHFHTDLRLALGYVASVVMIGVSLWSYFVQKEWKLNKRLTAVAVVFYIVLSSIQTISSYIQGDKIFIGKRKTLSNRIETEHLAIASPALPKATLTTEGNKKVLTPPVYALKVDYSRTSNGGKSVIRRAQDTVQLGHFGEWFTGEGEFVQEIFERRLVDALNRVWQQD